MKQDTKELGKVISIDDSKVRGHLDNLVRNSVEETLNSLLDAEDTIVIHEADVAWRALSDYKCVFQSKSATDSTPKLPPIPNEGCHLIQSKAATPLQG